MNLLILKSNKQDLEYVFYRGKQRQSDWTVKRCPGVDDEKLEWLASLKQISADCEAMADGAAVEAVALRVPFGGTVFRGPTLVTSQVESKLKDLIPQAPMHIPVIMNLIEACQVVFAGAAIVLVFETSFFADLPDRESLYGLEAQSARSMKLRRFGFCGIYHESACRAAGRRQREDGSRAVPNILSICLEPQPEISAVRGNRPMMVTGGWTPMEGIPGQSNCGEIDPSIVLALSKKMNWGPEQVNRTLTRESGLGALAGKAVTLEEVFGSEKPEMVLAQEVLKYRILMACGAGVAALAGVDVIVFSGRYRKLAEILGPYLQSKFSAAFGDCQDGPDYFVLEDSLDKIVADQVGILMRSVGKQAIGA
ncbi:MAG: acetate/propionate family kinase [Sedimentisphaerales bacterium]|nr:acetate/propionate family kinase [Sedimentisphaerales bacterium]